ncbi:MAG: Mg2+ and Co2+ transporter CorB [Firmicutes bacterium]|nr:Mg2+ and Co2+ transporter CorB [Bacillota bacterium]
MDDNSKPPSNEKKVKFKKNLVGGKKENKKWIVFITLLSFVMSVFFLLVSELMLQNTSNMAAFIIVFVIVLIGIVFDIIGIAVTAADEAPFHAMASRKYFGAKRSIKLIRNANKVSSFCNDVVGDICGIISGTAGALIVIRITQSKGTLESTLYGLVVSGTIAAVTVGGKAMGKTVAISNSNYIAYKVGVVLQFISSKIDLFNIKKLRKSWKRGNKTDDDLE